MSELDQESGNTEESVSLEQALAKNFSTLSDEGQGGDETVSEPEGEVAAEEVQASEDPLEPLERWSDEHKEIFGSLDRQAQSFLLDRHKEMEGDYTRKTQDLSELQKRYERIDEILNPYDTVLKQQGLDVAPYVGQALQAYFAFQKDPVSTLKTLIQTTNLTQEQLFEDDLTDPNIRALRQDLQQARNEIASLKQSTQSRVRDDGQAQIDAFKEAKDESGNLKHPHFDAVREMLAPLVEKGLSLEDAYEKAVWILPEHQKAQLEAEQKRAEKAAQAKNAEKVQKAKKASEVLPSSDVDKGAGKSDFQGWAHALQETLSKKSS